MAKVTSLEARPDTAYGSFGGRDYVRMEGRFTGELDPAEPIPGLDKAPRNAAGKVEYRATFTLIAPTAIGNGTLLLDVPNRGRPITHFMYNSPRGKPIPLTLEPGTGFLQSEGYSVASVQWELGQGIEIPSFTDAEGKKRFVEGVGPAALRDFAEFLRYGESGQGNPLAGRIERVIAVGYSQTARLLKTMLLEGFDQTEGAPVFNGMHVHASASGLADVFATGPGPASSTFFTPRFTATEHRGVTEEPLTYRDIVARVTGKGRKPPLMIVTNVTTDYYSIRASLARTGAKGTTDVAIPANVRIYDIAGGSHSLTLENRCEMPPGRLDFTPALRAALVNLDHWLRGAEPPASRVMPLEPRPDEPSLLQAPKHMPGAIVQAPRRDADGNSMGGVRLPDMEAPLGTHGAQNRPLSERPCNLDGAFIAFARPLADLKSVDYRKPVAERYPGKEDYVQLIRAAANRAVADRFLLVHDAADIIRAAQAAEVP